MVATIARIEPQTRIKTRLAKHLDLFKNMLEVGMSIDDIGKHFSKDALVEMLIHQTDKRFFSPVEYSDFEEVSAYEIA
jgi:predicted GNAT family acetyltransferase